MSYDIFFVRRDPGQSFEDALDDVEGSLDSGEPQELSDVDLEQWDSVLVKAWEILGDLDIEDVEEASRRLVSRRNGIELTMLPGEIEVHVPDNRPGADDLQLMSEVYELARAVEAVTGLEGYDPQLGEPVSDREERGAPPRRRPAIDDDDDDDDALGTTRRVTRPEPDLEFDPAPREDPRPRPARRWWEFWKR